MYRLRASKKNFQAIFRKTAALKIWEKSNLNVFSRVPFKWLELSNLTTENYPENWLHSRCFLWMFSSVENSITCIGMFRELPLLLSESTGCNATKMQTLNYISGNMLWKLRKASRKNSRMEFLFNKLQTYKLLSSALRVFKIQKIHKIRSTMTFLFVEADANKLSLQSSCSKQFFGKISEGTTTVL